MLKKELKLNLGCGGNKIDGFINIDVEPSCKPDLVCNFITGKLPYRTGTVDEVVFFHVIEHITKRFQPVVLSEIWRVLKPGANLLVSYPEFLKCVKNWERNERGKREFWEATIFGRQLYPSDLHVCIMHTPFFIPLLEDCGFMKVKTKPEPLEPFNTIVRCEKGQRPPKYEDLIRDHMEQFKLVKGVVKGKHNGN